VARVMAGVAAHHQVLVFTCHPHVVETLERACPDLGLIELEPSVPVVASDRRVFGATG
jgi:hypothetical protein